MKKAIDTNMITVRKSNDASKYLDWIQFLMRGRQVVYNSAKRLDNQGTEKERAAVDQLIKVLEEAEANDE